MLLFNCLLGRLLIVLVSILPFALAIPNLGIQRDWDSRRNPVISYSGLIKFDDTSIPGDSSKLSDAQFINLAKLAYDEMVKIWAGSQLESKDCPGAMIAMESEGSVYFASSLRGAGNQYTLIDNDNDDSNVVDSVGYYMLLCEVATGGRHRYGGRCAEPNVLRLYGDINGATGDHPPRYKKPPTTNQSPRVAVWGRDGFYKPQDGYEDYFDPCKVTGSGYGCADLVEQYGLKPVKKQQPDAGGQDNWVFSRPENLRC